ncbi:hypothetical protein OsI_22987 [Oryza sativa Indica Group]|uniref:Uncharacterized protein n=1 Tax=Oryza sativa subsp. indica TaxID=39946 RepID=A2YCZ4_ORYSI|nr:hypothetical protein OsI_22987 [Oryza sativa Indica Group]
MALPLGEDVFLVLGGRPGGNGRGLGDVGDDHGVVASLDLAHLGEGCGHRVHLLLGLQGRAKGAAVVRDAPLTECVIELKNRSLAWRESLREGE